MANDAQPVQADEWRSPVLGGIDAPPEPAKRLPRQQVSDASAKGRRQLFVQQRLHRLDKPFADLQRDIASEAITHDDVDVPGIDMPSFDVADEFNRRRFQELVS